MKNLKTFDNSKNHQQNPTNKNIKSSKSPPPLINSSYKSSKQPQNNSNHHVLDLSQYRSEEE